MASGDAGARKRRRLSRSGEFDRVYREGSSHANRFLVVYSFPRSEEEADELRLGVSVGRKVGGAVERNRVRRRLREVVRLSRAGCLRTGHDYVLIGRRAALSLPFERMTEDFHGAVRRLRVRK